MQRSGLKGVHGRPGFTMVELLTVIAIIAILAGILFPVFATVKRNVHKATCTTNMHSIAQGLKMYKDDHGAYPEALFGFVDSATGKEVTFLYPSHVKTKEVFRCPLSQHQLSSTQTVIGQYPVPNDGFRKYPKRAYPVWDSYDGQFEPANSPNNYIVKYVRHWSGPKTGFGDNPRQLLYRNPPEDTVVTWCTHHRDWTRATGEPAPETGSIDLVLFVGGNVKTIPSNRMHPIAPVDPQQGRSYLVGAVN